MQDLRQSSHYEFMKHLTMGLQKPRIDRQLFISTADHRNRQSSSRNHLSRISNFSSYHSKAIATSKSTVKDQIQPHPKPECLSTTTAFGRGCLYTSNLNTVMKIHTPPICHCTIMTMQKKSPDSTACTVKSIKIIRLIRTSPKKFPGSFAQRSTSNL